MHYKERSFKLDQGDVAAGLEFGVDEVLQVRPHRERDLHLGRAEPSRDLNGLPIGKQELDAWRAMTEVFIELVCDFRLQGALHVVKEQSINVAASESGPEELLDTIHYAM